VTYQDRKWPWQGDVVCMERIPEVGDLFYWKGAAELDCREDYLLLGVKLDAEYVWMQAWSIARTDKAYFSPSREWVADNYILIASPESGAILPGTQSADAPQKEEEK